MDFKKMEKKWQKTWEEKKVFEANVEKREKFFITFPYPYVNGAPHVGHSYSSLRTDAYARYKRMKGFNVLYPQGFHATGEPILGVIERLKKNDKVQINTLKMFGAKDSDIARFKKDTKYLVNFWVKHWIKDLKDAGFSIDWRRKFITTQLTPQYSRFVEWQYNTLKKKGYVIQGTHPVIWCPHCQSPTGDHDRLVGEGESPVEFTILKFKFKDMYICAATLRPETVFGQTNMWVNPDVEYPIILVNEKEKWIASKECSEKLKDQLKKVETVGSIKGTEMVGKYCTAPMINKEIIILPSKFCDPKIGTGLVTSVPSHAPFDWQALEDLKKNPSELEKYGINPGILKRLEPISIIKVEGFGEHPAKEVVEKLGVKNQEDFDKLKEALRIIYKKEHHTGVMKENCIEYAGMSVEDAQAQMKRKLMDGGLADIIWETTDRVVCRCTTLNHVKILENQWFLKFSDEEWKKLARKCVSKMAIYPDEARNNFENTIEWLKDKACTRKTGLGTPLPWDKSWIVETLGDSTIYMAYYTIASTVNAKRIPAKKLTDEVFDYIFLGKGNAKAAAKNSGLNMKIINDMKKGFEYFYPLDLRNSGKDLIQNHLTFFIFHHVAIFPEKHWPKGISVNGFVNVEGEKMSKSKGNIIPLKDLLDIHGADLVRINIISSAEGIDDADWRAENIKGIRSRLEFVYDIASQMKNARHAKIRNIDLYLQGRMQKIISESTENFEQLKFRTAVQSALFEATNELKWYMKRVGGVKNANKKILKDYVSSIARLLAPMTPHLCEEIWRKLGNKGLVSLAKWPAANKKLVNAEAEIAEGFLAGIIDDVDEIKKIARVTPKNISVFVANDWKFKIYEIVLKSKDRDINTITKEIMATDMRRYGSATIAFIQGLYRKKNELKAILDRKTQFEFLNESKHFLEKELGCKIEIIDAEESENPKSKAATPQKPGILLE